MVRVFSSMLAVNAHIVRGLFESQGLHPEVRGEARSSLIGGLPTEACYAEVWVPKEEAARAHAVLEEWSSGDARGQLTVLEERQGELSPLTNPSSDP